MSPLRVWSYRSLACWVWIPHYDNIQSRGGRKRRGQAAPRGNSRWNQEKVVNMAHKANAAALLAYLDEMLPAGKLPGFDDLLEGGEMTDDVKGR